MNKELKFTAMETDDVEKERDYGSTEIYFGYAC